MSAYCCIKLDLKKVLIHDARNHELKKKLSITCRAYLVSGTRIMKLYIKRFHGYVGLSDDD